MWLGARVLRPRGSAGESSVEAARVVHHVSRRAASSNHSQISMFEARARSAACRAARLRPAGRLRRQRACAEAPPLPSSPSPPRAARPSLAPPHQPACASTLPDPSRANSAPPHPQCVMRSMPATRPHALVYPPGPQPPVRPVALRTLPAQPAPPHSPKHVRETAPVPPPSLTTTTTTHSALRAHPPPPSHPLPFPTLPSAHSASRSMPRT